MLIFCIKGLGESSLFEEVQPTEDYSSFLFVEMPIVQQLLMNLLIQALLHVQIHVS